MRSPWAKGIDRSEKPVGQTVRRRGSDERRSVVHWLVATFLTILMCSEGAAVKAQTVYPTCYVGSDAYPTGTGPYLIRVPQPIASPGTTPGAMEVTDGDHVQFISSTNVRLTPGFHAGAFNSPNQGRFRARIDTTLGDPADLVIVSPDPTTHVVDDILHVEKWEKLELGLRLPQAYRDAIDRFFAHYYSNGTDTTVTPNALDRDHDLNPYADDSLQVVMTLISPSGQARMKWGFFMREARWESTDSTAKLEEDTADVLYPFNLRFRFAPDEEGLWRFALSLKAPHTNTLAEVPLPNVHWTGYNFVCTAPLDDNHGYLRVDTLNRRLLRFDDGKMFFGIGPNICDQRHRDELGPDTWWDFFRFDFDLMDTSLAQLHAVGGNYVRFMLMRHFNPEWVNMGVYDSYFADRCCDAGNGLLYWGNCQHGCWALDQLIDQAREQEIYIQLCIDPQRPGAGLETFGWGNNAYVTNVMEPNRDSITGTYDMKEYLFTHDQNGDPQLDSGIFYYWKRRYKYIMSRWAYSVNVAVFEPFNEIEQILGYEEHDLINAVDAHLCAENMLLWPQDPDMITTVNDWHTEIAQYVRGTVDTAAAATSALGEEGRPFMVSYATQYPSRPDAATFFLPFANPEVDLMDVHKYVWPDSLAENTPDYAGRETFDQSQGFRADWPYPNPDFEDQKPFVNGEANSFTDMTYGVGENAWKNSIEMVFHNYDVSFHNELWSGAFSGNFATGMTWLWERLFWWPKCLPVPPPDDTNEEQDIFFNELGATNVLQPMLNIGVPVMNRPLLHHIKPLSDMLTNENLLATGFFEESYTPRRVHDNGNGIGCYYMTNAGSMAIGWVHNLDAWMMNSYYLASPGNKQNLLGCDAPSSQSITLPGFFQSHDYYITYFPTRTDAPVPPNGTVVSSINGEVTLSLDSLPLGSVEDNYMDTLHSDYAFTIAPYPVPRRMLFTQEAETSSISDAWDFSLHPNPATDALFLTFQDDAPKDIEIYDLAGRRMHTWANVGGAAVPLSTAGFASGAYYVRVSNGLTSRIKHVIIHR